MKEDLTRKYLDGELDAEEVAVFLQTLREDQELAAEVAAAEEMLATAARIPSPDVPAAFPDQVMARIALEDRKQKVATPHPQNPPIWSRPLVLAASWVLAIGLGVILSRGLPGRPDPAGLIPAASNGTVAATLAAAGPAAAHESARLVRLAYLARDPDVRKVGIAGSFNGWDPSRTPMHLENGYWVADLLLPAGQYDYMFVINDSTWVTDPMAPTTRNDGFGRRNAVLELGI